MSSISFSKACFAKASPGQLHWGTSYKPSWRGQERCRRCLRFGTSLNRYSMLSYYFILWIYFNRVTISKHSISITCVMSKLTTCTVCSVYSKILRHLAARFFQEQSLRSLSRCWSASSPWKIRSERTRDPGQLKDLWDWQGNTWSFWHWW